jgi:uncharacterized YigZ family protein
MGRYYTISGAAETLLKIEGSKFIAEAAPVFSAEEAGATLAAVRKKYFDATHHCFAYAVGEDRAVCHYSDDGEPSGTAGIKIFSTLQSRDLSDIIVIVTRYFGGTKLGIGGLGRAYHDAAAAVLGRTRTVQRLPVQQFTVVVEYTYITPVMSLAARLSAFIDATEYTEKVTFSIFTPHAAADELERQLIDLTKGTAVITRGIRTIRSV